MSCEEVLRMVRGYADAGRILLTRHARERMRERGTRWKDVRHALANAAACSDGNAPGRWIIRSADLDGDAMTLVVGLQDGVVVVTLYE